jgi:hypothetical protein
MRHMPDMGENLKLNAMGWPEATPSPANGRDGSPKGDPLEFKVSPRES